MAKRNVSEKTKENILQAAKEVIIEKGYDRTKMTDIAKRAGVNQVMLYYHFDSKENIVNALSKRIIEGTRERLREQFRAFASGQAPDFAGFVSRVGEAAGGETNLVQMIFSELVKNNIDIALPIGALAELWEEFFASRVAESERKDVRDRFVTQMFFFQAVPLILFLTHSEQVARALDANPAKLEESFLEKFAEGMIKALQA
ncbi:MAG TPA: TetR/AcrR family transcriptional regulator [Paenibacillus sp.]|nr:TetR/AcrR family transcriptional regulator [Paenibacillus sp.]